MILKKIVCSLVFLFFLFDILSATNPVPISRGVSIQKHFVKNNDHVNWLVIHDNENDALSAMRWAIKEYGGFGYEVKNHYQPDRRILKEKEGRFLFSYDPNRIFTDIGIYQTLAHYNRNYRRIKKSGFLIIKKKIRKSFLKILPMNNRQYLIALHNNESRSTISVLNFYRKKGFFIFRNPKEDVKNFVIVTKKKDFEILMKIGINAVWQFEVTPDNNDGSLSVYCKMENIPYINIETRSGDIQSQKKIIGLIIQKIIQKK